MQIVPPRIPSSVMIWSSLAHHERYGPDLSWMRGAPRQAGLIVGSPLEEVARAPRAAARRFADLQKWPVHLAASGDGTRPSTPPVPAASRCCAAAGAARQLRRL